MAVLTVNDLALEITFHDLVFERDDEAVLYYNIWLLCRGETMLNDGLLPDRWSRPTGTAPGWIVACDWGECHILPVLRDALEATDLEATFRWEEMDEEIVLVIRRGIVCDRLGIAEPTLPAPSLFDLVLFIDGEKFSTAFDGNGIMFRLTPTHDQLQRFHDDLQMEHDAFMAKMNIADRR